MKMWDVNLHNKFISKLGKRKTNSQYLIGYLDKTVRPLVLIMPEISGYVKTFKVEDKINKLMLFRIEDEKLLEKYEAIWTKIEDLKNIKLTSVPAYDEKYLKSKTRTYGGKLYADFRDLNVLEDDIECESFIVISIDSLFVYDEKYYYLQVYLDNCTYKTVKKTNDKLSWWKYCWWLDIISAGLR